MEETMKEIIGAKLSLGFKVLYWLYKKIGQLLLKRVVKNQGKLYFGKVACQKQISNFLSESKISRKQLKIRELQSYLGGYLHTHIDSIYLKASDNGATKFIINFTRISTFFVFTDGENILLLDRGIAKNLQTVENDKLDCFGSVDFENSSLSKKNNK